MKKMKLQILFGVVLLGNVVFVQGMTTAVSRARGAAGRFQSTGQMQQRFQSKTPETKPAEEEQEEKPQQSWRGWVKSFFSVKPAKADDPEAVKDYMKEQLQSAIPFYETDRESPYFLADQHKKWAESGESWETWRRGRWKVDLEIFKNERLIEEYKKQLVKAFVDLRIREYPEHKLDKDELGSMFKHMVFYYEIPEDTLNEWVNRGCEPLKVFEYIDRGQRESIITEK